MVGLTDPNEYLVHAHGLTIRTHRVLTPERQEALSPFEPLDTSNEEDASINTTDINALSDDLLTAIFSRIPFNNKVQALQFVCTRWHKLHRAPHSEIWGALNLRVSNRYTCDAAPMTHMNVEVLEASNPFCGSHVLRSRADFLQWLTPRAGGFHVLNLILDIELPWENEVVACRRALWFVMTNTILPIIGLLSTSLKEVVITVAEHPDGLLSQHALLYSAPSAVACLAHALGNLPKLDFLMLDCLCLQSARAAFFADALQPKLEVVIVRGCGLRSLPNLPALTNLQGLDLSCNPLSNSWLLECLPQLSRLESLILCNCNLTCIPAAVAHLPRLRKLYLSHNTFGGTGNWAPPNLAALTNLQLLTMEHCAIQELPESIGRLQSLTSLDLQGNQLEVLPSSLSALTNLQTLQLASNSLTTIPDATLRTLTNLQVLDLSRQATRVTTDGVVLDLSSTVRVGAALTSLQALHKLRVLRLPTVELSDCEAHAGGVDDVAAVAKTVLHLNALRAAVVRGALARGQQPPHVDAE